MADYFKHEKAIVEEGASIGKGTRVWAFSNIQEGAVVGLGCNICDGCFIEKGAKVGNNVTIKHNVAIFDGVTIEDECFIASNIAFINDRLPRANRKDGCEFEKTLVKKGATLGTNAVILCGLTVGSYAMVGAGSVVTKDVADHALVVGSPARQIGYVCFCGFSLDSQYKCRCGKRFKKTNKGLVFDE
ncbi:MAG TPA: acyltransferase [Candidatus Omnitrophota bacterium]|nr:acyltransferase [Candidatus Omnitrophota bacterium]